MAEGGLGLGSLKALNMALTLKWWWRFKVDGTGLCSKILKGIHNLHNKAANYMFKKTLTGVWKNVTPQNQEWRKCSGAEDFM
uniref:RNA-directed DNA polymerase, eukaryota, Reverse transcriptase zinc-binding domain protein n=1 Tax=Lactuca sativa TaxID=4236 RepID=A0A9R1VWC0_LACSA|nr:hypothetical protein LSAT_V11C400224580 [Lactuca sativa]